MSGPPCGSCSFERNEWAFSGMRFRLCLFGEPNHGETFGALVWMTLGRGAKTRNSGRRSGCVTTACGLRPSIEPLRPSPDWSLNRCLREKATARGLLPKGGE